MPALIPIEDDALLAEVLATASRGRRKAAPDPNSPDQRTLNVWFKLRHKFIQEIPGVPEVSLAKCSNPACGDKPRGAVATVGGLDMCRQCFLDGYPHTTSTNQLTLGG